MQSWSQVSGRRGLRLLNPGVCGSNPGCGVIPLGKEFTTNFLPQVTALWRWSREVGQNSSRVHYEAHVLQSVVIQDGQTGRRTSACCCRYAGSPGSIQGKKQNVVVD